MDEQLVALYHRHVATAFDRSLRLAEFVALKAGKVKVATRCIDADHDKACGNETTLYPPLAKGVSAKAALAVEHSFTGKELNETWKDGGRRGAFVGTFATR